MRLIACLLAGLLGGWPLAALADRVAFWLAPPTTLVIDKQVAEVLGERAGLVVLRAPHGGPKDFSYPQVIARLKAAVPQGTPVLGYAWITRYQEKGRIESYVLRGARLGAPVVAADRKGALIQYLDVTDPNVRREIVERVVAARRELGVDGFALDGTHRSIDQRPKHIAPVCGEKRKLCAEYPRAVEEIVGALNAALGDATLIYNGLWNLYPGMLEDQARLLTVADGAAIEYFGRNPSGGGGPRTGEGLDDDDDEPAARGEAKKAREGKKTREGKRTAEEKRASAEKKAQREAAAAAGNRPRERPHSFSADILPYLQAVAAAPAGKRVLFFGRGSWRYRDYVEDYLWQRYLYASFLLARRKEDLFKYHSSFQVPAHAGRSGGLDIYADSRIELGEPRGPYRVSGGLYERDFANGRVIVAPDDGRGGSAQIQGTQYTPEGQAVSGTVKLAAGQGLILLNSAQAAIVGPASRGITAKQIGSWGWSHTGGGAERARLARVPASLEGMHDVLLDHTRSLAPFQRLRIEARALERDAELLAVAEVDDPEERKFWAVVAVGGAQGKLTDPVEFRVPPRERKGARWVQVGRPFKPDANGKIVLDGPEVFSATGLRFRRWSHLRVVGDVELEGIELDRRAPLAQ